MDKQKLADALYMFFGTEECADMNRHFDVMMAELDELAGTQEHKEAEEDARDACLSAAERIIGYMK